MLDIIDLEKSKGKQEATSKGFGSETYLLECRQWNAPSSTLVQT
jgi:hypothetical protein